MGLLEYFERHSGGIWVDASRLFLYKVERNLLGLDRRYRGFSSHGDGSVGPNWRSARTLLAVQHREVR